MRVRLCPDAIDPRTGVAARIARFTAREMVTLTPPGDDDWLLVIAPETTVAALLARSSAGN